MKSREYKAIKNFFRNTQKLDRQELKEILKEIIQETATQEVKQFLKSGQFERMVRTSGETYSAWNTPSWLTRTIMKEITEIVSKKFLIQVKVEAKDEGQKTLPD